MTGTSGAVEDEFARQRALFIVCRFTIFIHCTAVSLLGKYDPNPYHMSTDECKTFVQKSDRQWVIR
jgi:hypothetical protein